MKRLKLRDIAAALGLDAGCGDNSCMWGPPGGMATNGGCRCRSPKGGDDRLELFKMSKVATHLLDVYNVLGNGGVK